MNILLIGAGGREHTFALKLKQSPLCDQLFIAPGNAGTAACGTNLEIAVSDFEKLSQASLEHKIDMILVGPEEPLVKGISDFFAADPNTKHIKVIGPSKEASQLEGSKAFSKSFMQRHGIPTAASREFTQENFKEGQEYIKAHKLPIVLKADGLAAGKGVLICTNTVEALAEFELMIMESKFGDAGKKVVIEEFLQGIEMSIFVLTDGKDYLILPEAKDYKRIGEGDTGLNTGGMGAVSPVPILSKSLRQNIISRIIDPTIAGIQKDQLDYRGFVFIGLMIDNEDPYVIEYNCRMGDPETEVVISRLKNDLVELLDATAEGRLSSMTIEADPRTAVAMVAVSGGYPGDYEKGMPITGLDKTETPDSIMFHAGTKEKDGHIVTSGGRVLVAVSFGETVSQAAERSAEMLGNISYAGIFFRRDIGYEFM